MDCSKKNIVRKNDVFSWMRLIDNMSMRIYRYKVQYDLGIKKLLTYSNDSLSWYRERGIL